MNTLLAIKNASKIIIGPLILQQVKLAKRKNLKIVWNIYFVWKNEIKFGKKFFVELFHI